MSVIASWLESSLFINAVILLLAVLVVHWFWGRMQPGLHRSLCKLNIDQHGRDMIVKVLHVLIIGSVLLVGLQTLGVKISGLLAVGGASTLIVGLAAKDMLANLFGGFVVYFDQPFKIGETISLPEKSLEGTVEKISWRMSVIRTADKQPLYVPNYIFTGIVVQNTTRMTHRHINETMGLRYDDLSRLPGIMHEIETMLRLHTQIDSEQFIQVRFKAYGVSSLDFFVNAFTKTVDVAEFNNLKQELLLQIGAIVSKHGAQFAFPTTTIILPTNTTKSSSGEP